MAAARTTQILPAAQDEVSVAIAGLFGTHAQEFHALSTQASAFHQNFVQTLTKGAGAYAAAETQQFGLLQSIVHAAQPVWDFLAGGVAHGALVVRQRR